MKRPAWVISIPAVVAMIVAITASTRSPGEQHFEFVGLWEGIDAVDGYEVAVSISPLQSGELAVVTRSGHFNACTTNDPITNGKGILNATGVVKDSVLVADHRILHCANGVEVDHSADFIPNREYDLLTLHLRGVRDDLTLHRISTQLR